VADPKKLRELRKAIAASANAANSAHDRAWRATQKSRAAHAAAVSLAGDKLTPLQAALIAELDAAATCAAAAENEAWNRWRAALDLVELLGIDARKR
jgi:hypothetical protein